MNINPVSSSVVFVKEEVRVSARAPQTTPFIPSTTLEDRLLSTLFKNGVVDEDGYLIDSEGPFHFPPLSDEVKRALDTWLDYPLKNEAFPTLVFTVRQMLSHQGDRYPVSLIGGTVRRLLAKWFLDAVEAIPGCDCVEELHLLRNRENKAPDDFDIRVQMNGESFDALRESLDHLLLFFAKKLTQDPSQFPAYASLFRKKGLHAIQDMFMPTQYTMLSVCDKQRTVDISFAGELPRDHLFLSDALSIDLLSDWPQVRCSIRDGGAQSILDNLLKIIHIDDVKSVNDQGLFRVMRALTVGFRLPEEGVITTLFSAVMRFNRQKTEAKIEGMIEKCYRHHIAKGGSPVQMTYFLNALTIVHHHCPNEEVKRAVMRSLLAREYDFKDTPCSKVMRYLVEHPERYAAVEAFFQLGGLVMLSGANKGVSLIKHDGKPALQWNDNGSYWVIPLDLEKAFKTFLEHSGDLSELDAVLDVRNSQPGPLYRHFPSLDIDFFDHWRPSSSLIFGLAVLTYYQRDASKSHLVRAAFEAKTEAQLIRNLREEGGDFLLKLIERMPRLKKWDCCGSILFEFYLEENPVVAAEMFFHESLEDRALFSQLVSAYQKDASLSGELLVASAMQLKEQKVVVRRHAKKVKEPVLQDLTNELLFVIGGSQLRADALSRFRLLQHASAQKLLKMTKRVHFSSVLACLESALPHASKEDILEAMKDIPAQHFNASFLIRLLESFGSDPHILALLKEVDVTEEQKARIQTLGCLDQSFLVREQRYSRALDTLKSAVKSGADVVFAFYAVKKEALEEVEHEGILKQAYEVWCDTHVERAVHLFSALRNELSLDPLKLLLVLPCTHQQLRNQLFSEVAHLPLKEAEGIKLLDLAQEGDASLARELVDRYLPIYPRKQVLLRAIAPYQFDLKNHASIVYEAIADDLSLAHQLLPPIFEGAPQKLLRRLANEGPIERRIEWMRRLKDPLQLPAWVEELIQNKQAAAAVQLMEAVGEEDEALWKKVLVHLPAERAAPFAKKKGISKAIALLFSDVKMMGEFVLAAGVDDSSLLQLALTRMRCEWKPSFEKLYLRIADEVQFNLDGDVGEEAIRNLLHCCRLPAVSEKMKLGVRGLMAALLFQCPDAFSFLENQEEKDQLCTLLIELEEASVWEAVLAQFSLSDSLVVCLFEHASRLPPEKFKEVEPLIRPLLNKDVVHFVGNYPLSELTARAAEYVVTRLREDKKWLVLYEKLIDVFLDDPGVVNSEAFCWREDTREILLAHKPLSFKVGMCNAICMLSALSVDKNGVNIGIVNAISILSDAQKTSYACTKFERYLMQSIVSVGFSYKEFEKMFEFIISIFSVVGGSSKQVKGTYERLMLPLKNQVEGESAYLHLLLDYSDRYSYIHGMLYFVEALIKVDLESLAEDECRFWLSFTAEHLVNLAQKLGDWKSKERGVLFDLFHLFVCAHLPNKDHLFDYHKNVCCEIMQLLGKDLSKADAKTVREMNFYLMTDKKIGNLIHGMSISEILRVLRYGAESQNLERVSQSLFTLSYLQNMGLFDRDHELLSDIYLIFIDQIKEFSFSKISDPREQKEGYFFDFVIALLIKGPAGIQGHVRKDAKWLGILREMTRSLCRELVCVQKVGCTTLEDYANSDLFEYLHNVIICHLYHIGDDEALVESMLPMMGIALERRFREGSYEEMWKYPLSTEPLSLCDSQILDPLFAFRTVRSVSLFEKWIKKVIEWGKGAPFYPRLEEAAMTYKIYPSIETYRARFEELVHVRHE